MSRMLPDPRTPDVTDDAELRAALAEYFGFATFLGPQEEIISKVLAGEDSLVIMATGDGKSLCYQLPALMSDGLTLVVSPLIALMEDQVLALQALGLPADCIHSMLCSSERSARMQRAIQGELKLLYVTPERFRVGRFLEQFRRLDIALLAVDEAHCVSHWGHDFRPDYRRLGLVRKELGNPTCIALTATATPEVQEDIRKILDMADGHLFHTGIERENLYLSVHEVLSKDEKLDRILEVIDEVGGPGIVYSAVIKDLHELEDELRRRGFEPIIYHGKLSSAERRQQQAQFLDSPNNIILATNAFGMGVDKADIRFILHYQIPRTLEAYYQEIGRAGRDRIGSFCELIYLEEDVSIQQNFTEWANPDQAFMRQVVDHLEGLGERLLCADLFDLTNTFLVGQRHDGRVATCLRILRAAGCIEGEPGIDLLWLRRPTDDEIAEWLPTEKRKRDLMSLLRMVQYARVEGCRKRHIHEYFGFADNTTNCGSCEFCYPKESWLAANLPESERVAVAVIEDADSPRSFVATTGEEGVARGDWLRVRPFGLCTVKRVHRRGKRICVDVELASNLEERSIDLWRVPWRRVEHPPN